MKLLILTRFQSEYEPQRLAEEARKKGIDAEIIAYDQISLSWQAGKVTIGLPGKNKLDQFSFLMPRSSAHRSKKSLIGLKTALLRTLPPKTICLNRQTYDSWPILGKIEQGSMLTQKGIPVIPAWFLPGRAEQEKFLKKAQFPMICKSRFGSHSKKTFRVEDKIEAEKILTKYQGEFFFQPLVKSFYYWRVLVLGGQIIGVMERKTNKRFLKTLSDPGSKEVSDPGSFDISGSSSQIEKLALQAHRDFKAEFTGVDILIGQDQKPLVIEVNRSPQFQIFEKKTGVNVSRKIINYLTTRKY